MNTVSHFAQPDSYRIETAARLFSLNVDHLMQLAIDGTIGLFIHGGGRDFLEIKHSPGSDKAPGTFRSEGSVSSHWRMYVDRADLSAILATGSTVLTCALVSCEDSARWFVPGKGAHQILVSSVDLWILAKDVPHHDTQYAQPAGEKAQQRKARRLQMWKKLHGGQMHEKAGKWIHSGPSGEFTKFLARIAGEKGASAKTVRKDLADAAKLQKEAAGNQWHPKTSP